VPAALTFALLGAIESLLSAVVADGMTGRQHRSNSELFAQGIANVCAALFGGMCVTGTIARTATNVRAGARTPVAGMLHSVIILLVLLVAAPLVGYVPLAALAAVLVTVAWNMIERPAILHMLRHARGEAAVLFVTLVVTLLHDLVWGIAAGVVLALLLRGAGAWFRTRS
jgi:SulP family sulfate permease